MSFYEVKTNDPKHEFKARKLRAPECPLCPKFPSLAKHELKKSFAKNFIFTGD